MCRCVVMETCVVVIETTDTALCWSRKLMHCVLITMVTHHWYVIIIIIIIIILYSLTFLAVIPSVTWGRAKMQKTVTPRLTRSMDCETDGHAMVITVVLRCRESVIKLTIQLAAPCHLDLIDTISSSNRCMLTLYCLIAHSTVIS